MKLILISKEPNFGHKQALSMKLKTWQAAFAKYIVFRRHITFLLIHDVQQFRGVT